MYPFHTKFNQLKKTTPRSVQNSSRSKQIIAWAQPIGTFAAAMTIANVMITYTYMHIYDPLKCFLGVLIFPFYLRKCKCKTFSLNSVLILVCTSTLFYFIFFFSKLWKYVYCFCFLTVKLHVVWLTIIVQSCLCVFMFCICDLWFVICINIQVNSRLAFELPLKFLKLL